MARYGQAFKDRAVARLLPPQSAAVEVVAREVGVGVGTLERWREDAHSRPARGRAWNAAARLEAVITTAAMDETAKGAWCREHGMYPLELDKWRSSCAAALADPEEARASPQATRQDKKRIKELERDLLRKDRALVVRSINIVTKLPIVAMI
ncbi:MAG TPA: hypothetical protein PLL92_16800, partial [Alicycliphilus sp.]|nr:hypothetical protein [Alicycliphilus sp.]